MFTGRDTTSARVTSATADCSAIRHWAIVVSRIVSVGSEDEHVRRPKDDPGDDQRVPAGLAALQQVVGEQDQRHERREADRGEEADHLCVALGPA